MRELAGLVNHRRRLGFTPRRLHSKKFSSTEGVEQDHTILIPRPAAEVRHHAAHTSWRPAGQINDPELRASEEPDGTTIRRPEWSPGTASAGQWMRLHRIERPDLQLSRRRDHERQVPPIGRQGEGVHRRVGQHGKPSGGRMRRRPVHVHDGQREAHCADGSRHSRRPH